MVNAVAFRNAGLFAAPFGRRTCEVLPQFDHHDGHIVASTPIEVLVLRHVHRWAHALVADFLAHLRQRQGLAVFVLGGQARADEVHHFLVASHFPNAVATKHEELLVLPQIERAHLGADGEDLLLGRPVLGRLVPEVAHRPGQVEVAHDPGTARHLLHEAARLGNSCGFLRVLRLVVLGQSDHLAGPRHDRPGVPSVGAEHAPPAAAVPDDEDHHGGATLRLGRGVGRQAGGVDPSHLLLRAILVEESLEFVVIVIAELHDEVLFCELLLTALFFKILIQQFQLIVRPAFGRRTLRRSGSR
mmetsp:Transcript_103869/g.318139  ORF Transcript_103869/g.318139 Transcript_103869/m.318139 type:complete len:301 (-) Transcript_103869:8-910(-)